MPAAKINAKKILDRVKNARTQLESLLKDRTWLDEAKKVAEKQGKEVKKIIDTDVAKLRVFLEKERKELEKLQTQIPGEVDRIKKFVDGQKKELSKLLTIVKKGAAKKPSSKKAKVKASNGKATHAKNKAGVVKKKTSAKKPSSSRNAAVGSVGTNS